MSDYFMNLCFNFGFKRFIIFLLIYLIILYLATVRLGTEWAEFYEAFAYTMAILVISFILGLQCSAYLYDHTHSEYAAWAFLTGAGAFMLLYSLVLTFALFYRILNHRSKYISISKTGQVELMASWIWGSIYAVLCLGAESFVIGIITNIYFLHDPSHPMFWDIFLIIMIFVGPIIVIRIYPRLVQRIMNLSFIREPIVKVQNRPR